MHRWGIVLAVVFALSVLSAALVPAATTATKMPSKAKVTAKAKCPTVARPAVAKRAATATHKYAKSAARKYKTHAVLKHRMSAPAKKGAGPRMTGKAKCRKVTRWVCPKKPVVRRTARPAAAARGPMVNCPAPVVNVPEQPAPVVNVPQQPAPVVNVASPPPTVGITTDNCFIYIVRGDQLMVLDKNTYELKKTISLQ